MSGWAIYSIILDKVEYVKQLKQPIKSEKIYNLLSRAVMEKITLSSIKSTVRVIVDRRKQGEEIKIFDNNLRTYFNSALLKNIRVIIEHQSSQENMGLQAVDLFSWGIYKKYETSRDEWYKTFQDKIKNESIYDNKKDGP